MKDFSWALVKGLLPYFIIMLLIMVVVVILLRLKNEAKKKIDKKIASIKTDGGVCPKCGGELIMRDGKYGKFIGCSNFPKCRYTQK